MSIFSIKMTKLKYFNHLSVKNVLTAKKLHKLKVEKFATASVEDVETANIFIEISVETEFSPIFWVWIMMKTANVIHQSNIKTDHSSKHHSFECRKRWNWFFPSCVEIKCRKWQKFENIEIANIFIIRLSKMKKIANYFNHSSDEISIL